MIFFSFVIYKWTVFFSSVQMTWTFEYINFEDFYLKWRCLQLRYFFIYHRFFHDIVFRTFTAIKPLSALIAQLHRQHRSRPTHQPKWLFALKTCMIGSNGTQSRYIGSQNKCKPQNNQTVRQHVYEYFFVIVFLSKLWYVCNNFFIIQYKFDMADPTQTHVGNMMTLLRLTQYPNLVSYEYRPGDHSYERSAMSHGVAHMKRRGEWRVFSLYFCF